MMEALRQDLTFALRWLRGSPGFAAVVVLTLALGIGANTAMFSVVDAVLLRPLPYRDSDRLVGVWPGKPLSRGPFVEFRDRVRTLEPLAAYSAATGFSLAGDGDPERVEGSHVSADLFRALGAGAARGRVFQPGEDQPGRDRVVVLSDGLWRERFGADPAILGRQVRVDGVSRTVVGVMPAGFRFPSREARLWIPISLDPADPGEYWGGEPSLALVGRLRPGADAGAADAEIRTLADPVRQAAPWPLPAEWTEGAGAAPLRAVVVGDAGTPLLVLLGAVALVMLIACANVANLLLARNAARQREIATRAALGASRARILAQLLTESVLLSVLGGALGLALAGYGVRTLAALLPADIPRAAEIGIDARVLAFTAVLAVATGVVFGLLPALRASRADLQSSLKEGGKGTAGVSHRRLSGALVAAEVALAVTLVIGAGLLVRSLGALLGVETGFRAERVVTARVSPPKASYADEGRTRVFYGQVLERVRALPGVQDAAIVHRVPLGGEEGGMPLAVEGAAEVPGAAAPFAGEWRATPAYLRAMGIPLLRGRAFTDADAEGAPAVALVNEEAARRFWPGQDPVGRRIRPVWWREWVTVVGVVGNVKDGALTGSEELEVYRPFAQAPVADMHLVVRTAADPAALAGPLRRAVWSVDPDVPVSGVRTMEEVVRGSLARPRFTMLLLSLFALLALALGAVGIYGVISYAVAQRSREIGIRVALGAGPGMVTRMVLRQGVLLAAAGVAAGVLGALAATRLLASLLFGVSPADPLTFAAVAATVLAVAALASWLPARRATRLDPMRALRAD